MVKFDPNLLLLLLFLLNGPKLISPYEPQGKIWTWIKPFGAMNKERNLIIMIFFFFKIRNLTITKVPTKKRRKKPQLDLNLKEFKLN